MASSSNYSADAQKLSPVTIFEWVTAEIRELKRDEFNKLEALALERQSINVAQFMQNAFQNIQQVNDVPRFHLKIWEQDISNEQRQDFYLIGSIVKKLLKKVIQKKVQQREKPTKEEKCVQIEKEEVPYFLNRALMKNSNRSSSSPRAIDTSIIEECGTADDEDDDRILKIPPKKTSKIGIGSRSQTPSSTPPPLPKFLEEGTPKNKGEIVASNLNIKQEVVELDESIAVMSMPIDEQHMQPQIAPIVPEQQKPNSERSSLDVIGNDARKEGSQDRFLRRNLREDLGDIFAKDDDNTMEPENDENADNLAKEKEAVPEKEQQRNLDGDEGTASTMAQKVKEEIMSEDEEEEEGESQHEDENEGENEGDDRSADQMANEEESSPSSPSTTNSSQLLPEDIAQQRAIHKHKLPTKENQNSQKEMQNTSTNSSNTQKTPPTLPNSYAKNILNTVHSTISVEMDLQRIIKRTEIKQSPGDDVYSEFTQLAWHKDKQQQLSPTQRNIAQNIESQPTCSGRIRKRRRIDYEEEQREKKKALRKEAKVRFNFAQNKTYHFHIDDGNTFDRYAYDSELEKKKNLYQRVSKRFMKGPLGATGSPLTSASHRQITGQIQSYVKQLIDAVIERSSQVNEQNERAGKSDFVPAKEKLVTFSRLLITDSFLRKLDEQTFRNMQVLKLDIHRNMKNLLTFGFDQQCQYIKNNACRLEYSYIFILYGYDLICHQGQPTTEISAKLRQWFLDNLSKTQIAKTKEDPHHYYYTVPQFVLVTIPPHGEHPSEIRIFNEQLRNFVQESNGGFLLLDWANLYELADPGNRTDESVVGLLVRSFEEYGVLVK